jgi:phage tail sheath protein FI
VWQPGHGALPSESTGRWKYVNARRYFIVVEGSVDEETRLVVFEPNSE